MEEKLITPRLILSSPSPNDWSQLKDFSERNQKHFAPWETLAPTCTDKEYQEKIKRWRHEISEKKMQFFFIRIKEAPQVIIGICHFSQIIQGPFQACYLGYKIDHAYEKQGYMQEALKTAIAYLFEKLHLHRIMANYMPSNKRSARLLERLGFAIEGYAKNYLLINGSWRDHVLTALTKEEWQKNLFISTSTQDSFYFREVKLKDAAGLISLMKQLGYEISESEMLINLETYLFKNELKAWIVEKNGQLVGCIATALTTCFHRAGSFLRIISLVVDQNYRGFGLGKQLLQLAEKYAQEKGCAHVELTSGIQRKEAHLFYLSQNYTELNATKKYFAKKI